MSFMSDPIVRAITDRSDFLGSDASCGATPTTIFIQVPPADQDRLRPDARYYPGADERWPAFAHAHRGWSREDARCHVAVEEFPALCRCRSSRRSSRYAVRLPGSACFPCAQDRAQIRRSYSDKEAITANMSTIAVMPGFSDSWSELEEWAVGHAGDQVARPRGRASLSVRTGENEERRPILNPGDLLKRRGDILVFALGVHRRGGAGSLVRACRMEGTCRWRSGLRLRDRVR